MDLSASLVDLICLPTGAFLDLDVYKRKLKVDHDNVSKPRKETFSDGSADAFRELPSCNWRLDGIDGQGTQIYAIPLFFNHLTPKRIDLFIPSQDRHPPELRKALGSAWSFCIRDSRVNNLGLARLVLNVLEIWTNKTGRDAIEKMWTDAPFGSRLVIDRISSAVEEMSIRFVKDFDIERQMLPLSELLTLWKFAEHKIPQTVGLDELHLLRQLHDTVSLVKLPDRLGGTETIFKSSLHDVKYMYHELKLLMTMESHPNIMARPKYLVTSENRYGGGKIVLGFILPWFGKGNLADELGRRRAEGSLLVDDQLRWAIQITQALQHVNQGPAKFYSELKADNLLLDDDDNVVLIDFEQMGNWTSYSAPEIHNIEYCMKLSKSNILPEAESLRYKNMLEEHIGTVEEPNPIYDNPEEGYYTAWTVLTPDEQESAEVFSLGKTLWCIFEGCSDTRNSVLKAFKRDFGQEFPEFKRTPEVMRALIVACTQGNRDGEPARTEIIRIDDKVYPRNSSRVEGLSGDIVEDVVVAAEQMWKERVRDMELFLEAKLQWKKGQAAEKDKALLGFMKRPKLQGVLESLMELQSKVESTACST